MVNRPADRVGGKIAGNKWSMNRVCLIRFGDEDTGRVAQPGRAVCLFAGRWVPGLSGLDEPVFCARFLEYFFILPGWLWYTIKKIRMFLTFL